MTRRLVSGAMQQTQCFERGERRSILAAHGATLEVLRRSRKLGVGGRRERLARNHGAVAVELELQIPQQQALADKLVAESFADTVFFTNSGTESCELAVKMARKYWFDQGEPERVELIAFEGAFHGRSSAGIAAAGSEKMTKGFGPKVEGFDHFDFGDHKSLKKKNY